MRMLKILFAVSIVVFVTASAAMAGDFDWMRDFNIKAQANPAGFRAQMATRFKIGDAQISVVLSNVDRPADAYMVFRLGEMSRHPADYVLDRYKSRKGNGWGVLAKSLGIKPGSKEFHALKRGDDLYDSGSKCNGKGKSKGKWKDKD